MESLIRRSREPVTKLATGPEETRCHRPLRHVKHLRDLPMGKSFYVHQADHCPEVAVECVECRAKLVAQLLSGEDFLRCRRRPSGERLLERTLIEIRLNRLRSAPPAPLSIEVSPNQDREKPRAGGLGASE